MEKHIFIKIVIFDFDGTLVDLSMNWKITKIKIKDFFNHFNIDEDFTPLLPKIEKAINTLSPEHRTLRKEQVYKILDDDENYALEKSHPIKNSKALLEFLAAQDIKIVIVTRNGSRVVKNAFQKFHFPDPHLILSRDSAHIKPNPKVAESIFQEFTVKPDECLIIGDSEIDSNFGKNTNIKTLILNNTLSDLIDVKKFIYA